MELLTVREAAQELACHEQTVRRAFQRGWLTKVRTLQGVRVRRDEVDLIKTRGVIASE